jgi:hypothetical protein
MSNDRPLYVAPPAPVLPYASGPAANNETNLWVEGDTLVVRNGTTLPPRCVKCNAPVTSAPLTKKFWWHHPGYYLLILLHIIIYAVVAMIVRKSGTVRIGLCETHRLRRRNNILIAWSLSLLGLMLLIIGIAAHANSNGDSVLAILIGLGPLTAIVGLIWGIVGARILRPKKIDDHFLWLAGASLDFLQGEGMAAMPTVRPTVAQIPPQAR